MGTAVLERAQLHALLEEFKTKHAEEYGLLSLGYFGSYARGEAGVDSDVDVVFDTDSPNLFRAVRLRQDLEELLGRSVDILQLRGVTNPRLKERIEREAVYV